MSTNKSCPTLFCKSLDIPFNLEIHEIAKLKLVAFHVYLKIQFITALQVVPLFRIFMKLTFCAT